MSRLRETMLLWDLPFTSEALGESFYLPEFLLLHLSLQRTEVNDLVGPPQF